MDLLNPTNLQTAATIDKGNEIFKTLLESTNPDEIGDAIEAAASDSDLAMATIFRLLGQIKGWEMDQTGVERVAAMYDVAAEALWTPHASKLDL